MLLAIKHFTYFGHTDDLLDEEIAELLKLRHVLALHMTKSTCLSSDLYKLNQFLERFERQNSLTISQNFIYFIDEHQEKRIKVIVEVEE